VKKIIHNIYAFFYISLNWNIWLAIFIFWHEIKRGPKYRINTIKPMGFKKMTITGGDVSKSSPYEAVSYYLLEKLFIRFRELSTDKTLTDLGCGKGRVLVAAAFFGFNYLVGVEFGKELCQEARKNLTNTAEKIPGIKWEIHYMDVLDYSIQPAESVFFLFNPFNAEILERFIQKLNRSLIVRPRKTWFIYASPVHATTLQHYGYEIVYHIHPGKKLEGMILKKEIS
jgi:SAM-dependent methyltransferase